MATTKPTTKPTTKFQVFVNGSAVKKTFAVTNRNSLWTQFNRWANAKGADRVFDTKYLGSIGWRIPQGIAEVREVAITKIPSTKIPDARQNPKTAEELFAARLTLVRDQMERLQDQLDRRRAETATWADAGDMLRVLEGLAEANRVLGVVVNSEKFTARL